MVVGGRPASDKMAEQGGDLAPSPPHHTASLRAPFISCKLSCVLFPRWPINRGHRLHGTNKASPPPFLCVIGAQCVFEDNPFYCKNSPSWASLRFCLVLHQLGLNPCSVFCELPHPQEVKSLLWDLVFPPVKWVNPHRNEEGCLRVSWNNRRGSYLKENNTFRRQNTFHSHAFF